MAGAALLLVACVLTMRPAKRSAARLIGTYGTAAICAATTGLVAMFRIFPRIDELPPGYPDEIGLAPWLLLGSSVPAIAALVLVVVPRTEQWG